MSGQPSNTKSDQVAFRKEYMKSLNQQIANDDKNYDANQIFKKTGAPQQPTDTRSTTEKLRDIQALKPTIRSKLLALMDGGEAEKVVSSLPDKDIEYLAQNVDNMVSLLKPRFKIGMYADIFLLELGKYAKNIDKQPSVDGLITKEDLTNLINDISGKSSADAQQLAEQLQMMTELIPTEQEIQNISALQDKAVAAEAFVSLGRLIRLLPTKADLLKEENNMNRLMGLGDEVGVNRQIAKLVRLTENAEDMRMEAEYLASLVGRKDDVEAVNEDGGYIYLQDLQNMGKVKLLEYVRFIKQADPSIFIENITAISKMKKADLIDLLTQNDDEIRGYFGVEPIDEKSSYDSEVQYSPLREQSVSSKSSSSGETASEAGMSQASRQYGLGSLGEPSVVSSKSTSGNGLRKKVKMGRGVGRPKTRNYEGSVRPKRSDILTKEDTDWNAGIKVQPRFVPFGRYIINKRQLDKNIVSIKTPSGSNVPTYRSHRVSTGMGIVLRKMTGGGNPSFDELNALDEEERNYLSRIATASNIDDKFNIPTPSKKEDEKDINQFEIMRGEIMAGNDSTELVKKFKILIMKLSKKGLLPQREAKDLLYELVHLGY